MKKVLSAFALIIVSIFGLTNNASAGFVQEFTATGQDVICLTGNPTNPTALCSTFYSTVNPAIAGAFVPIPAGTVVASFYEFNDSFNADNFFFQQNETTVFNPTFPTGYDSVSTLLTGLTVSAGNPPARVPGPISSLTFFKNGPGYTETITLLDGTFAKRTANFGSPGSSCGGAVLFGSSICLVTEGNNGLVNISYANISRRTIEVPIPSSLLLLAVGLCAFGFGFARRR
jgi:hypothetical protein